MSTSIDRGIIVAAAGSECLREFRHLHRSLRRHHPELPIQFHSDQPSEHLDGVEWVPITGSLAATRNFTKIIACLDTPFERTLLLDTDLWITGRLDELFQALDRVDYACKLANERDSYRLFEDPTSRNSAPTPDVFPERNTGVLAFRRSAQNQAVLEAWKAEYERQFAERNGHPISEATARDRQRDQPPFRAAVYTAPVKELIFTDEWNANLALPTMVKGRVHVLHAHLRELESGSIFPTCRTFEAAEKLVNKTYRPRIIWPSYGVFAIPPTRRELLELTGCMVRDAGRRLLRVTGLRRG